MLERLIEAGAELDTQDDEKGWTALMHATYAENGAAVELLERAGANEEVLSTSGKTAADLIDDFYDYDAD